MYYKNKHKCPFLQRIAKFFVYFMMLTCTFHVALDMIGYNHPSITFHHHEHHNMNTNIPAHYGIQQGQTHHKDSYNSPSQNTKSYNSPTLNSPNYQVPANGITNVPSKQTSSGRFVSAYKNIDDIIDETTPSYSPNVYLYTTNTKHIAQQGNH
jgi:hypothetical protein